MLQIIILSVFVLTAIPITEPIRFGTEVTTVEFPFAVHLSIQSEELDVNDNKIYTYESTCGGTLFKTYAVLTAAHCLTDTIATPTIEIHAGDVYLKDFGKPDKTRIMGTAGYIIHPEYDEKTNNADIAIIKFSTNFRIRRGEIELGNFGTAAAYQKVTIMGWGAKEDGESSDVLLKGAAIVVKVDNGEIHPFDATQTTSICSGDSGSPLVNERGLVIGVASNSFDESEEKIINGETVEVEVCSAEDPSVYMNVHYYSRWISLNK